MAVPSSFTDDLLALHGLITREEILKYARFNVVGTWGAIGCGWSLIKGPTRSPITSRDALGEDLLLFPEGENLVLGCREVDLGWQAPKSVRPWRRHLVPSQSTLGTGQSAKIERIVQVKA